MAFCKEYNAQTAKMAGEVIPVEITVFDVRGCRCRCCCRSWLAAGGVAGAGAAGGAAGAAAGAGPRSAAAGAAGRALPAGSGQPAAQVQLAGRLSRTPWPPCAPQDRSFTFILKTPPAAVLLKKAAGGWQRLAAPAAVAPWARRPRQQRPRTGAALVAAVGSATAMGGSCTRPPPRAHPPSHRTHPPPGPAAHLPAPQASRWAPPSPTRRWWAR
jgi:hypothetical protein